MLFLSAENTAIITGSDKPIKISFHFPNKSKLYSFQTACDLKVRQKRLEINFSISFYFIVIDIILIDTYMSDDNIVLPKLELYPACVHDILLIFAPASEPRKTENLTIQTCHLMDASVGKSLIVSVKITPKLIFFKFF